MTDYANARASFATREDAFDAMWSAVRDEDCVDNSRFAFACDPAEVADYEERERDGCCGFYDREVYVGGRLAFIGCNYGH